MTVRAIRGATQLAVDSKSEMKDAVVELLTAIMEKNGLTTDKLISVLFTSTPDLVCDFPAAYAREMGLGEVPLICAVEIAVPGSLPRTIRAMVHCDTDRGQQEISHVYLRGATVLRKDIAQ